MPFSYHGRTWKRTAAEEHTRDTAAADEQPRGPSMVKDIPVQEARSVASSAASDSEDRASDSPPSKRKKAEKATQIQTACMYCAYLRQKPFTLA